MNNHTTYAVDVAKSVFEIAVSNHPGHVCERHRLSRERFLTFFAHRKPATVLLEACGSSHHWARTLGTFGHHVVLLPPHRVRPYVAGNKTDRQDAKALLEAARNQDIKHVPVKSIEQQSLAALHRTRSAWIAARTARLNGVRGFLRELGVFIPRGARRVRPALAELLEDPDSPLPNALRPVLAESSQEIAELERRLATLQTQLNALARSVPDVQLLRSILGIGPITATALVAFVGGPNRFPSGRHFASYLGLTPKEHSSGLTRRLGGISKRGNTYLRMLLIHGARSVLASAKRTSNPDPIQLWALEVERQRGHNKAAVALANKLARITWAVWRNQRPYERRPTAPLTKDTEPTTDC
jgi:transposase